MLDDLKLAVRQLVNAPGFAFVAIENGHPVNYWAAHAAEDRIAKALLAELAQ